MIIDSIKTYRDKLLGRGEAAISIPTLDGACRPNRLLEDAEILATLEAPEDLATDGQSLFVADGNRVFRFDNGKPVEHASLDGRITALACLPGGVLAVALDGRRIIIVGGRSNGTEWTAAGGKSFVSVNSVTPTNNGKLLVTDGSASHPYEKWCFDMMELGHSGRLVEIDLGLSGEGKELRRNLRYAFGCCVSGDSVWVSETWNNRVIRVGVPIQEEVVTDWLPGYPCRITPASDGGFWLCAFAGRTHLVEFVLREPEYRIRMMHEVDPRYWIAPALNSGDDFLEPMQGAGVKSRGILKPYAPPRSYGLVIKLDASGTPVSSFQSRLDGKNHGVIAAVECCGTLYVLAKGPRRILQLPLGGM